MTFLTVAGEILVDKLRDIALDPTGEPEYKYDSTNREKISVLR